MTEDEMARWHHRLDEHEFEQALGVGDGQGDLVCCSPWVRKESDITDLLNELTDNIKRDRPYNRDVRKTALLKPLYPRIFPLRSSSCAFKLQKNTSVKCFSQIAKNISKKIIITCLEKGSQYSEMLHCISRILSFQHKIMGHAKKKKKTVKCDI